MKRLATLFSGALLLFPAVIVAQDEQAKKTPASKTSAATPTKADAKKTSAKRATSAPKARTKKTARQQKTNAPRKTAKDKSARKRPAAVAQASKPTVRTRKTPQVKRDPINARTASTRGPMGLESVWSADPGPVHTARLRFSLGFFDTTDFPTQGSENRFAATDLAVGYTAHRLVETFLSFRATGNTNFDEQPALLQTQGDIRFGVKVGGFVNDMIAVGGAIGMRMLTGVGQGGFDPDATSFDFRLLTTFDLHRARKGPTRLLVDLGFVLENSGALVDTLPTEPSLIQEFGLQIANYNRLTLGLGIDSPFSEYVSAFVEYGVSLPILVQPWVVGEGADDYSFSSVPHSLTLGVRGFPVEELAIDFGVRIGLSDEPFTGVPATPPWTILFGVAYTLDPRPKVQFVEKIVEKKVPKPVATVVDRNAFGGRVVDSKTQQPIKGATVIYPSSLALSPQVTDAAGRFGGYELAAGPVTLSARAQGYKPITAKAAVKKGQNPSLVIKLEVDPDSRDGLVEVRVFDPRGRPMAAQVSFSGDAAGVAGLSTKKKPFSSKVKGGRHPIMITAKGYQPLKQMVTVRGGDKTALRFTMQRPGRAQPAPRVRPSASSRVPRTTPRSPAPPAVTAGGRLVRVSKKRIDLRRPVTFAPNSATINAGGKAVLNQLANGLKRVKAISRIRIGAHVVSQSSAAANGNLSNSRARAVRSYLVGRGVDGSRLQARGYGSTKPRYPNFSPRGKRKNERVEFTILKTQ